MYFSDIYDKSRKIFYTSNTLNEIIIHNNDNSENLRCWTGCESFSFIEYQNVEQFEIGETLIQCVGTKEIVYLRVDKHRYSELKVVPKCWEDWKSLRDFSSI